MKKLLLIAISCVLLTQIACKKDEKTTTTPTPTTPAASVYFTATINGQAVSLLDKTSTKIFSGVELSASSGNNSQYFEGSCYIDTVTYNSQYTVGIYKNFTGTTPTATQTKAMLGVNTFPYSLTSASDGAFFSYTDANNVTWSTQKGVQTGSTFKISEYIVDPTGLCPMIATYEFSCKIYDGNGNSKTVTNGKWRSRALGSAKK